MVKQFTVPCDFGGKKYPITFYIGEAAFGEHPIGFQSKWLATERGGKVPQTLMDSLAKLKSIADETYVSFEQLCTYVIEQLAITEPMAKIEEKKEIKEERIKDKETTKEKKTGK